MRGAAVLLALAPLLTAAPSQAAPDAATLQRGEEVYARCAGCHAIQGNGTDGPMTVLHLSLAGEYPFIPEPTASSTLTMSLESKMPRKSAGERPR